MYKESPELFSGERIRVEKFRITGSTSELANVLGLTEAKLQVLAVSAPKLYRTKHEPKKDGSFRIIHAPFKHLKEVQKKILTSILNQIPIHRLLHGGPNTSTKSAARVHVKQPVVITLDIQDFFPSVRAETVRGAFEANGFNREVASLLTRLVTHKKRLPQGAPTSSAIARIVLFNVCKELEALLETISPHAQATIYVDDVTIRAFSI
jgi:retron-type reverse transcriptase